MKGKFVLEGGEDRGAVSDEERSYLRAFNGNWYAKGQPLTAQLCKFLVAIYKAESMSADELKFNPGHTTTQDIINSRCQTFVEHQTFKQGIMEVSEKMFSSPELEAELSAVVRKRKRESELTTFNKLQLMAADKLVQLDEFISLEVSV